MSLFDIKPSFRSRISWIGNADNVRHLYKYMDIERAFDFLRDGSIYFVEPTFWKDPYEKRFYNAEYPPELGYVPPKVFCACFTHRKESEAAWRMYSKNADTGIASRSLQFRLSKKNFLDRLQAFAVQHKCFVYVGTVNYHYDRYQIDNFHTKASPQYDLFFKDFNLEKYLTLLLVKRKDFEYENEIRIFIVQNDSAELPLKQNQRGLLCPLIFPEHIKGLIQAVTIDPNCTELEIDMIRKLSDPYLPEEKRCRHSELYTPTNRITIEI